MDQVQPVTSLVVIGEITPQENSVAMGESYLRLSFFITKGCFMEDRQLLRRSHLVAFFALVFAGYLVYQDFKEDRHAEHKERIETWYNFGNGFVNLSLVKEVTTKEKL